MATLSTATSNFNTLVTDLVKTEVQEILAAKYVHLAPGNGFRRATITGPMGGHNLLRFPAYAQLAANTTALTEGTPPTAQSLTISSNTLTAPQLGQTVEITDLALLESPTDLADISRTLLADQAANSLDVLVRDILQAGTSVKYANGTARSAVSANISDVLVKQMRLNLESRNVPRFGDGYFRAILSPNQGYDLMAVTAAGGWIDSIKYTAARPLITGEIGEFAGFRFMVTSNNKVFTTAGAGSVDVHSAFFFGPDCYAVGDLQTLEARMVPAGGDHSDPLGQKIILGWKAALGATLLNSIGPRYIRLETAATSA